MYRVTRNRNNSFQTGYVTEWIWNNPVEVTIETFKNQFADKMYMVMSCNWSLCNWFLGFSNFYNGSETQTYYINDDIANYSEARLETIFKNEQFNGEMFR